MPNHNVHHIWVERLSNARTPVGVCDSAIKFGGNHTVVVFIQRFRKLDFSTPENQHKVAIVLATFTAALLIFTVTWATISFTKTSDDGKIYNLATFDQYDAAEVCGTEMETRLGNKLLRHYMDERSSRYDKAKGVYRIYLHADVGDLQKYDEIMIYCFVDRWDFKTTYYKEVNASVKELLSTDLKFF